MSNYGFNLGYIDELYARYRDDPESVSEAWREFFADYRPVDPTRAAASTAAPSPGTAAPAPPAPAAGRPPGQPAADAEPLVGISARIAENMTESLRVPTATSARDIPVKLLEENRRVINLHQQSTAGPKISFTHLIAWAIVRGVERHPGMNAGFEDRDGKPHRLTRTSLNLGLAIDVERRGERLLLVPNVKDAGRLSFPELVAAYDDLVLRTRNNKLELSDFEETTITLTNPGMIGTAMSVPRLMAGQGAIIGVGSIGYPAEYAGMAPEVISELGLSKLMTVTSTYDHRVIQGAESGAFLATLGSMLQGEDRFYERIFKELTVPHEPVPWTGDQNPAVFAGAGNTEAIEKQAGVLQFIRAHRVRGHLWADLDPLGYEPLPHAELELSHYGLSVWDLDRRFIAGGLGGTSGMLPLREIVDTVRETYCRHIGVEYMHIQDPEPRHWLQERMEGSTPATALDLEDQKEILRKLNAAEAFEKFLHSNYIGQKRFSLEGAETLIPMLDFLLRDAAEAGVEEAVIGMAHRGRLNVLGNIVGKSYRQIFEEFEGYGDPETTHGSGDVKFHLGASGSYSTGSGKQLTVRVASNPSHLEAVDPVVEGMVRARQDRLGDRERSRVLPVLIHGDAAFAGQGVVAETFNLSQLSGYRTGGTVHIVVNNQIGFTTGPRDARSSTYATDLAKMVAPIFHVNGDQPEDAVRVIRLALAYRQRFKRDVVVDVVCYRRWGHNEADDPSYTHPILYAKIKAHRSVRKLYTEQLLRRGDIDPDTAELALQDFRERLESVHEDVRQLEPKQVKVELPEVSDEVQPGTDRARRTAVEREVLERVLDGLERRPEGFRTHPKLDKQLAGRRERFEQGRIDWALAEALGFGSLVLEGRPVRLSGEDSGRGTFSQRHAVLYDYLTAAPFAPLAHLAPDQAPFYVYDSLLSEFAVLGFEYGYSVDDPEALVLWEAQFGDFVNGAQVIIDQFISSADAKWGQRSGVTLLLPHGYEGQGPDHSSARFERFLQLAAHGNIRVVYPSTPAQYFHVLRRQAVLEPREPLILLTPKSLLRHKDCVSTVEELASGEFQELIEGPDASADAARRLVFCSGKVYYDLLARRQEAGIDDVAIARLEQFYPYPGERIRAVLSRHSAVRDVVWVQEEPKNMGAWSFLSHRMRQDLGDDQTLQFVGRSRSASPATGSHQRHVAEQEALVREALEGKPAGVGRSAMPTRVRRSAS